MISVIHHKKTYFFLAFFILTTLSILTPIHAANNSYNLSTPGDYALSNTGEITISVTGAELTSVPNISFVENNISGDVNNSYFALSFDADGDNDLDIYVVNYNNQQNNLWINNGAGSFSANDIPGDEGSSLGATAFDADNDGDLDIYVANEFQQNNLWINDGAGNFTLNNISTDTDNSINAISFDANGDGNLDIYVSNRGQQNKLWINDGAANFTANHITGDIAGDSQRATAFDFDEDGDQDLYVANFSNEQNNLWVNDGSGNFSLNTTSLVDNDFSVASIPFDADNDGDLDLFVSNSDEQNNLWINNGAGVFVKSNISSDTDLSFGASVFDVNDDNNLDLYIVNAMQQNKFWVSDSTGNFTLNNISTNTGFSVVSIPFDADADGDKDLYVANYGEQNKLWINQTSFTYSSNSPYIQPNSSQSFIESIESFSETLTSNNQGTVTYQVSTDNGVTWNYWDGSSWTITTQTDGTETSSASDINTNIITLDTNGGDFLWRGYLNSDGTQRVELDQIDIIFDATPPLAPTIAPDLQSGSDTGISNSDNITKTFPATFDLICSEIGGITNLYADGNLVGTGTACTSVGEIIDITAPIYPPAPAGTYDGTYTMTYTITDAASNQSAPSPSLDVVLDTISPIKPGLQEPTTNEVVVGTGEVGATAYVYVGTSYAAATSSCNAQVDSNGDRSCALTPLPSSGASIGVIVEDIAGNTSNETVGLGIVYFEPKPNGKSSSITSTSTPDTPDNKKIEEDDPMDNNDTIIDEKLGEKVDEQIDKQIDEDIFNQTISDRCYSPLNKETIDQGNRVSELFLDAHQMLYSYKLTKWQGTLDFNPYGTLTREQAARFMVEFAKNVLCRKKIKKYDGKFTDIDQADSTLIEFIKESYEYGIFQGYPKNSTFRPQQIITPDELSAIIVRMLTNSNKLVLYRICSKKDTRVPFF